jgi:prepilin-type N-terminal cleavage/methylation domain-containing protein
MRGARGFSLVELLATLALIGLLAGTALGLTTILAHAVTEDEVRAEQLASSVFNVRSFRADASRADQAFLHDNRVTLVGEGTVQWAVRGGKLRRVAPTDPRPGDRGSMRLDSSSNGTLVIVELSPYGRIVARVGGAP